MAKVIAYRNDGRACVCKIRFNSREKVLVSVAGVPVPGIRVMSLLFGIIPYKNIWEISVPAEAEPAFEEMVSMLGGRETGAENPLDAVILKLRPCRSWKEAAMVLRKAARAAGLEK